MIRQLLRWVRRRLPCRHSWHADQRPMFVKCGKCGIVRAVRSWDYIVVPLKFPE